MVGLREKFPFSIECKNVERLNVWDTTTRLVLAPVVTMNPCW